MRLNEKPYESMKTGRKFYEVRLNDEKRRLVEVGDTIDFLKLPEEKEKLKVEVIGVLPFDTFKDLYESLPAYSLDCEGMEVGEMVENTYKIYTPEQEGRWGVLAIEVKLV